MPSKMPKFSNIFIFVSILLIWCGGAFSLRINKIRPTSVSVDLECDYDLEGESLYAIKWYRGRREIYRYTPNEKPAAKAFPINGIMVNLEKSTNRIVSLEALDGKIAGSYSCEVTTDAPSFNNVIERIELKEL